MKKWYLLTTLSLLLLSISFIWISGCGDDSSTQPVVTGTPVPTAVVETVTQGVAKTITLPGGTGNVYFPADALTTSSVVVAIQVVSDSVALPLGMQKVGNVYEVIITPAGGYKGNGTITLGNSAAAYVYYRTMTGTSWTNVTKTSRADTGTLQSTDGRYVGSSALSPTATPTPVGPTATPTSMGGINVTVN